MATSAVDRAAGRAALLQAQQIYLGWLEGQAECEPSQLQPDRLAFNRLAGAVAALESALQAFDMTRPSNANRARLLALLQGQVALRPKSEHSAELDKLDETLLLLRSAAAAGGGRGLTVNGRAWVWVVRAADCWVARGLGAPSGAERGKFWKAFDDFQHSDGADGRSPRVPVLGRDAVVAILKHWRERRELWGG